MGSLVANGFPIEDMELFRSMASRAALAIEHHIAKEAIAQAARVREDILAIVSHDLRSPLGAVLSAADLLRRVLPKERNELALKSVLTIQRSVYRMTRLVEDLLDYGSIESGQLRVTTNPEIAADIIADVMDGHAALAAEQNVRLECSAHASLPPIRCDRGRISQVFGNLISNALKASPANTTITIGAEVMSGGVRFSVSDEGTGIEPAEIDHIFERYWRVRDETSSHGRGLGLAIVKGIVEAHGGTVGVKSTVGKGSTFYFELPLAADAVPGTPNQRILG
jgi:signal transduction histidine kinase